ncbi:serine/threonine-protein kinase Sgk2 [Trichoderma velutinum]
MDEVKLKIIEENPIRNGFDAFREKFTSICDSMGLGNSPDAFDRLEQKRQTIAYDMVTTLPRLRAAQHLGSASSDKLLLQDILEATIRINSSKFDFSRIKPLLEVVLDNSDDVTVWTQVYEAFSETTPTPPLTPLSEASLSTTDTRNIVPASGAINNPPETPWNRSTASISNSSESRREIDPILRKELGNPRVGIRKFRESFFERVPNLEIAAAAVFDKCCKGDEPIVGQDGWKGWPPKAREDDVLAWFENTVTKLEELATDYRPANLTYRRKLLRQPRLPLIGSTGRRSMDIGFINDDLGTVDRYHWSHILVPGELKSNPAADAPPRAWIDLATYVREVLSAEGTRRFALAFTLCGPCLRLWEYDRGGRIIIFVAAMLGFLWIDEEGLGFDPSIMRSGDDMFIEIERDGKPERLIIDEIITRPRGIVSRATTCWKVHLENDPLKKPLVVKDSWQYTERDEEGLLLKEAMEIGVINVARYYHHETVRINGITDDVRTSIRKGLDIAADIAAISDTVDDIDSTTICTMSAITAMARRRSTSSSASSAPTRRPREANLEDEDAAATEKPVKRSRSAKSGDAKTLRNREHRRVVLDDYGMQIHTASSPTALLEALECCIRAHESLKRAGFLHRDISINNLLIDEDRPVDKRGFLIDLDLGIKTKRTKNSGAKEKTGTRAFMAIEVLFGKKHSFMHDLESFFWVLFWICVHYDGPNKACKSKLDEWNFMRDEYLAGAKLAMIYESDRFCQYAKSTFTPFYEPLIPLMDQLRDVVFPNGRPWKEPNEELYSMMREILLKGHK